MMGSDWITALIGAALGLGLLFLCLRKLQQLHAHDRSGYTSDLRAASKLTAPANALYTTILILVDTDVLSPRPWYTMASAIVMIGLSMMGLRL